MGKWLHEERERVQVCVRVAQCQNNERWHDEGEFFGARWMDLEISRSQHSFNPLPR